MLRKHLTLHARYFCPHICWSKVKSQLFYQVNLVCFDRILCCFEIPDLPPIFSRWVKYETGWWFGTFFILPYIKGISSSQLTFIFFRRVAQPPTRRCLPTKFICFLVTGCCTAPLFVQIFFWSIYPFDLFSIQNPPCVETSSRSVRWLC